MPLKVARLTLRLAEAASTTFNSATWTHFRGANIPRNVRCIKLQRYYIYDSTAANAFMIYIKAVLNGQTQRYENLISPGGDLDGSEIAVKLTKTLADEKEFNTPVTLYTADDPVDLRQITIYFGTRAAAGSSTMTIVTGDPAATRLPEEAIFTCEIWYETDAPGVEEMAAAKYRVHRNVLRYE